MCLMWQDEIYKMTLYKQKNILSRLQSQHTYREISFHINTQLKSIASP